MAAENKTVNGNYGVHQSYGQAESYVPSQGSAVSSNAATAVVPTEEGPGARAVTPAEGTGASKPPSKDEVGWYFVESYYTTLSKNPETLHAIGEKIKELDFQECKVRVSNVDSQESYKSIVVMVIGEISNKAAAHRKFTQTFVLAEQPNGYFVLNDMFRYLLEDEEESVENGLTGTEEPAAALPNEANTATLTSPADPAQQQQSVEQIDKKLEEEVLHESSTAEEDPTEEPSANGRVAPETAEVTQAEDAPVAAVNEPGETEKDAASAAVAEEAQTEKPRDPEPTPVASPPKPAKAVPVEPAASAAPAKPAARKTWANLVAANRAAAPAVPNSAPSATSAPPAQPKAAPSATNRSVTPPTSAGDESPAKAQQNGNAGWQMAGAENNKKQGRQHAQSVSGGQGNVMAYVKNVTDKVDASILKSTLLHYGKLPYFDNCAFVEFEDQAAYNAAVAANPHSIGGEQIYVEERRPRSNAYGGNFAGRGGMRGGRGGNEGRPGSQGRGGFSKDGGRGGFAPRGRGGAMTPTRGRGQPQAA
ncbi:hypothetical protein P7C71_g4954, partial [Lecanoromycetidae sp. Uapishka_2]